MTQAFELLFWAGVTLSGSMALGMWLSYIVRK